MYKDFFKPVFDYTAAFLLLLLLSPLLLGGLLLSWVSLRGNPFFTHMRPGLDEKPIYVLKIRTMLPERDDAGHARSNLQRVTPIGHFLRNTSIDELPQLINVIKGDLSLVGPRPLEMRYLPFYTHRQRRRHSVKPGITGLAQISGRNLLTWDQKFELDIEYIERMSLRLDLAILLRTVVRIFRSSDVNAGSSRTVKAFVEKDTPLPETTGKPEQESVNP